MPCTASRDVGFPETSVVSKAPRRRGGRIRTHAVGITPRPVGSKKPMSLRNQKARLMGSESLDPRLSVSRYFPSAGAVFHFSYDRVFQTPSFENLLLSSSAEVESLDPGNFLRLPVQPSQGNYYELGLTKAFFNKFRLDANLLPARC
jgi:hypothetical protein